jgi:hypothetical protein
MQAAGATAAGPWNPLLSLDFLDPDLVDPWYCRPLHGSERAEATEFLDAELLRVVELEVRLRLEQADTRTALQDCAGWEQLGFALLGDYARERPGISLRSAQSDSQVARALRKLPLVREALVDHAASPGHATVARLA